MSSLSIESAVRTTKVDTAQAARMESSRFLNPTNSLCPIWRGVDTAGRPACAASFMDKAPGCVPAGDRIGVENGLRPQYSQYITLSPQVGVSGDLYSSSGVAAQKSNVDPRSSRYATLADGYGSFGTNLQGHTATLQK